MNSESWLYVWGTFVLELPQNVPPIYIKLRLCLYLSEIKLRFSYYFAIYILRFFWLWIILLISIKASDIDTHQIYPFLVSSYLWLQRYKYWPFSQTMVYSFFFEIRLYHNTDTNDSEFCDRHLYRSQNVYWTKTCANRKLERSKISIVAAL